jgi:hypothetical protein
MLVPAVPPSARPPLDVPPITETPPFPCPASFGSPSFDSLVTLLPPHATATQHPEIAKPKTLTHMT